MRNSISRRITSRGETQASQDCLRLKLHCSANCHINIRQAAEAAAAFFADVYEEQPFSKVLLEEVDTDDHGHWLITLGFDRPASTGVKLLMPTELRKIRAYKVFIVNRTTGEIESMKLREE